MIGFNHNRINYSITTSALNVFKQLRYRLLASQLAVLAVILMVFAIAVRVVFARSLLNQVTAKLAALGQGAGASAEFEGGIFKPDDDNDIGELISQEQGLQWFDLQGKVLNQMGKHLLNLPLAKTNQPRPLQVIQLQAGNERLVGVTVPFLETDSSQMIGYIRVSQSLEGFDDTLRRLDLGLAGGIVLALVLSGIGGIWLTEQAMQPIEQSFHQLRQFTADASHELRSPIMAIKSNAAVALKYREGMRAGDAEKFGAIASATQQMARLTEDLLFLARTARTPQPIGRAVDVAIVLADLAMLYQPRAEAKSLSFRITAASNLWVKGDAAHLSRLFSNLLDNALHYTQTGQVDIKAVRAGSHLQISVQDSGIGIALDQLPYLFDRFWRADQSRAYWSGGSGLGLAIAQDIAQRHGGKIMVTSQINIGSCFTVTLPADASSPS